MDLPGCFNADGSPAQNEGGVVYPNQREGTYGLTAAQARAAVLRNLASATPTQGLTAGETALAAASAPGIKPINLQKVLIIYNADIAQSLTDALDYVQKRKLNPDLLLGFHFGTQTNSLTINHLSNWTSGVGPPFTGAPLCATGPYVGSSYLRAVASTMEDHAVEAVILSTCTPAQVSNYYTSVNSPAEYTLAGVTSHARMLYRNNWVNGPVNWTSFPTYPYAWSVYDAYEVPTLSSTLTADATQLELGTTFAGFYDMHRYDTLPCTVKVGSELIYVQGYLTLSLPQGAVHYGLKGLVRGVQGTTPTQHDAGTPVEFYAPAWVDMFDYPSRLRWPSGYVDWTPKWQVDDANPMALVPHGRLGLPSRGSTIAELPLYPGGDSVYQHAVTTGLQAEGQDHHAKVHVISYTNNYDPHITAWMNGKGADWLKNHGFKTIEVSPWEEQADWSYAPAVPGTPGFSENGGAGAVDPSLPPFFACCLGQSFNSAPAIENDLLGKVLPGAWGFTWTSCAYLFGEGLLRNGAAAAICTAGEPLSNGMPNPVMLQLHAIRHRLPLMLAHFLAGVQAPGSTVYGDPLYAPYLSTALPTVAKPASL